MFSSGLLYTKSISSPSISPVLVIDIEELNFADKPEDLGVVIDRINAEINGLF